METTQILRILIVILSIIPTFSKHTDIILLGSTGDLADKYLWKGLFNLFLNHVSQKQTFTFYACGRSTKDTAEKKLQEILHKNVRCESYVNNCLPYKEKFLSVVSYFQLKTDIDYQSLGEHLTDSKHGTEERDIIFYLSIPPESAGSTAEKIHKYCHLVSERVNFRIVFEKPFGYDTDSAVKLLQEIDSYFTSDEIYRIDHYLGKLIVKDILPFRKLNPELEKIWNGEHIERIEVVLKETVDCKGRLGYYSKNGVIRDVLQNHLMEVLMLLTLDLDDEQWSVMDRKLQLVDKIDIVKPSDVLLGQYDNYQHESEEELSGDLGEFVPTFAAARLSIRSQRWDGVPIILISGKSLDERTSYARVVFKNDKMCLSNCFDFDLNPQIIFHIGHGKVNRPMIMVSKYFHDVQFPDTLTKGSVEYGLLEAQFWKKQYIEDGFHSAHYGKEVDAYTSLIDDIFHGKKDNFVGDAYLVDLWRVWSKVLEYSAETKPRIYKAKDPESVLNFKITSSGLEFLKQIEREQNIDSAELEYSSTTYLGRKLVTAESDKLVDLLAQDIIKTIRTSVHKNFHIALSGGKTPIKLFKRLAESLPKEFENFIHIWQVDERCVSHDSEDSNFRQIWKNLIMSKYRSVEIPYDNIHPIPVATNDRICDAADGVDVMYEKLLRREIQDLKFDYVVLGLGSDGHTASLFPQSSALSSTALVELIEKSPSECRVTLTIPIINQARHISVLVTGKEKQKILNSLEESESMSNAPILKINPRDGHMTWFIDSYAFPQSFAQSNHMV